VRLSMKIVDQQTGEEIKTEGGDQPEGREPREPREPRAPREAAGGE